MVYANTLARAEADNAGEEQLRGIPFLKAYTVFNVEQIEGLGRSHAPEPAPAVNPDARITRVESWFATLGVNVRHGGGSAFYVPSTDHVQMPVFERFCDAQSYYATLGHECVHWTGHADRLARDFSRSTQACAREELVAELGAHSSAPTSGWRSNRVRTTRPISTTGSTCCAATSASSFPRRRTPSEAWPSSMRRRRPEPRPPHQSRPSAIVVAFGLVRVRASLNRGGGRRVTADAPVALSWSHRVATPRAVGRTDRRQVRSILDGLAVAGGVCRGVDAQIEAFIETWMRDNRAVLEEIVLLQADDPSTPYGAAMAAYLDHAEPWVDALASRPGRDR